MEHCPEHEKCILDNGKMDAELKFQKAYMETYFKANDERIARHKQDYQFSIDEILTSIQELKDSLLGTIDKKGLKTIVMEHEDFIKPQRESLQSIINWVYKGAMVCGMVWVVSHLR